MRRPRAQVGVFEQRPAAGWIVLLTVVHPPMMMAVVHSYAWGESRNAITTNMAVGSNRRAFDRKAKEFREITGAFSLMAAFGLLVAALAGAWFADWWGVAMAFAAIVLVAHSATFYINEVVRGQPLGRVSMSTRPSQLLRIAAVRGAAGWLVGIVAWRLL